MGTDTRETREARRRSLRRGDFDPDRPPNPGTEKPEPLPPQGRPPQPDRRPAQPPPARHCWVDTEDRRHRIAGLLLTWEDREDGRWGLVAMSRWDDAAITVTRWMPIDQISPA